MLDSIEKSARFDLLSQQEKKSLISIFSKGDFTDFEVDQLLMNLAAHGQWEGFRSALRLMPIRRRLAPMLPQMQEIAATRTESESLVGALPQRLDADTALIALDLPVRTRIWSQAKDLIDRGAYLSFEDFRAVTDRYESEKDLFDRKLITCLMEKGVADWHKALGFHDLDGWKEIMARAISARSAALYLCASCLMNSQQKKTIIRTADSKERLLMAIENMNLTGNWQQSIPALYRDDVFAYHLGL